ncbi:hypothetical protein IQ254_30360 [Nodosilinea sp. LEGE 07088]|uniref:hypothetical protein n=1 Tax=Nodosilinea sp. LEGE 07088 TaxID=2777968 RepID=UPI00187FCEB5|nr:hypothetical protein [Nodosilinea sp. LEGE 07088]MBE9141445.1 hypothetical protein [Nodosilinea sp. LEGE 07088]
MGNSSGQDWPFADPKNVAVFSTREISQKKKTILWVSHDSDDGAWQFTSGENIAEIDHTIVSLERIVKIDPSVKELADLPLGWKATRENVDSPWKYLKTLH